MHIQNRTEDVKALITHALQDYFQLDIVSQFPGDGWKIPFSNAVNNGVNDKNHYANYIATWNRLQRSGLQNYTVQDMDVSIVVTVLKSPQFIKLVDRKIGSLFSSIRDTRNLGSHDSYKGDCPLLFQQAHGALHILRSFITAVADNSPRPQVEKLNYYNKYDQEIGKLSKLLESDYDEWLKARETDERIRNEISTIQNSPNPFKTYVQISERYRLMADMEQEMRFRWATTEAGIPYACPFLGDLYFHGLTVPVDYEKAAELYEKGWDCLTPEQVLNLASIYINQLSSKKSKSEGESIRDLCKPGTRNEISTYTTKEGHIFWRLRRIKSDTQ